VIDGGVVHHHVDAAEVGFGRGHQSCRRARRGEVKRDECRGGAELSGHRFAALAVAACYDHVEAVSAQPVGNCQADA
jgi:hypothetical protein